MKRNAIALTGGIGSGKSAVGNYLRQKGAVIVDTTGRGLVFVNFIVNVAHIAPELVKTLLLCFHAFKIDQSLSAHRAGKVFEISLFPSKHFVYLLFSWFL